MSGTSPRAAMILAAGFGTRMRPLTDDRPKAMVEVAGRPMIDHTLDRLETAGIEQVVVNLHYRGETLERHLAERPRPAIAFSQEERLRGTAGGVRAALDSLGPEPFYVINGDVVWLDGPVPVLRRLAEQWNDAEMDALLVVVGTVNAVGVGDRGDFVLDPHGRPGWPLEGRVAPFGYAGIQLVHPRLFDGLRDDPVAMPDCWDRAMAADRLRGIVFDGAWAHVGTPRSRRNVDRLLEGHDLRWVGHGL